MLRSHILNHTSTGNSRMKIITCASSNGVPFCNTLHVDHSDSFKKTTCMKILRYINDYLSRKDISKTEEDQCKYIIAFYNEFRNFSSGTRITYRYVYKNEYEYINTEVIQYFILLDLGICIRIGDYTTNYFYGGVFTHCSSVPLFIRKSKVYIRQDYVNIVATGVAGINETDKNLIKPLSSTTMKI